MMLRPALIALCVLLKVLAEIGSTIHIIGYCWYAAFDNALVALSRRLD